MHPRGRRYSSIEYCPIFSVVAPCPRGASPPSVLRRDLHHGLLGLMRELTSLVGNKGFHQRTYLIERCQYTKCRANRDLGWVRPVRD